MMPCHTRSDIDVMLCHSQIILRIDVANVNECVAHLVLPTVDECVDHLIDTLVSHHMYVDYQTVGISLACQLRHFLFRPIGNALVTVGIERVHDASTCLHTTVEKQFNPPRYDACGFKLLASMALAKASSMSIQLSIS